MFTVTDNPSPIKINFSFSPCNESISFPCKSNMFSSPSWGSPSKILFEKKNLTSLFNEMNNSKDYSKNKEKKIILNANKINTNFNSSNELSSPLKRKNSEPFSNCVLPTKKAKADEDFFSLVENNQYETCFSLVMESEKIFLKRVLSISQIAKQFNDVKQTTLSQGLGLTTYVVQSTPSKAKRRVPGSYEQLFLNAEKGFIQLNKFFYTLTPFGEGTFAKVYKLHGQSEIQKGVDNNNLLVKLYSPKSKSFSEEKSPSYMTNSIANYHAAIKLGLQVSTIYNIETALIDKYFVVELIPGEIDLGNDKHLEQVQRYIRKSFENKIPFDLSFSNLHVAKDGETVTLIDFIEKPVEFSNAAKLLDFTITYLKSWAKKASETTQFILPIEEQKELVAQLLTKLTEGLEAHGFDPEWIQEAIKPYFIQVRY